MITYVVIGALVACLAVAGYVINNLLKKLEVYEGWINEFEEEVQSVYVRLKEVDEKNLFEKDDDVGFVFSELLRILDEFNRKIK